jgi:hypothetical protein
MLIGAASAPDADETLMIQAASYMGYDVCESGHAVYLLISVSSPSRGPVTNLRRGNLVVEEGVLGPIYDLYTDSGNCYLPVMTEFHNIGDGFHVVELEPGASKYCRDDNDWDWWSRTEYALRIKVTCPWGVGIGVTSIDLIDPCNKPYFMD